MEWGVTDRLDDVRLCVSELATNALPHGVPPGREFSLRITIDGSLIRVEVRDSGGGCLETGRGGADDCGGRGLHIVQALSDDFGVTPRLLPAAPGRAVGYLNL